MKFTEVIKRPLVTEKSNLLKEAQSTYSFAVDKKANKLLIKKAVESLFSVKVACVRTSVVPGKTRRSAKQNAFRSPSWKKAFVTLKEGKIELFDGV